MGTVFRGYSSEEERFAGSEDVLGSNPSSSISRCGVTEACWPFKPGGVGSNPIGGIWEYERNRVTFLSFKQVDAGSSPAAPTYLAL